jgi:hypothetical protein
MHREIMHNWIFVVVEVSALIRLCLHSYRFQSPLCHTDVLRPQRFEPAGLMSNPEGITGHSTNQFNVLQPEIHGAVSDLQCHPEVFCPKLLSGLRKVNQR